jgi:hypothetical protein
MSNSQISLQNFATGDTDYISKLNTNNGAIQSAINLILGLQQTLGNTAVSAATFFPALFGTSSVVFIGAMSPGNPTFLNYQAVTDPGGLPLFIVYPGYAWSPSTASIVKCTAINRIAYPSAVGDYYIVLDASGNPFISTSSAGAIYSFSMITQGDGSLIPASLIRVGLYFPCATDETASLTSDTNSKTFTTLDDRLEYIETAVKDDGLLLFSATDGASGGTNNYYLVLNDLFVLQTGVVIVFQAQSSNTGATTITFTVGGAPPQGPYTLTKGGLNPLVGGEIVYQQAVAIMWDGTRFQLLGSDSPGTVVYNTLTTLPLLSSFQTPPAGVTVTQKSNRLAISLSSTTAAYLMSLATIPPVYTLDIGLSIPFTSDEVMMVGLDLSDGTKHLDFAVNCSGTATPSLVIQQQGGTTVTGCSLNSDTLWLRITEDGTTRNYYVSKNGFSYKLVYSEASGTWLSATQVGIYTHLVSEATANSVPIVDVFHLLLKDSVLPTSM